MLRPYLIRIVNKGRTRVTRRRDTLRRLALQPALEGMEARIAPATHVWSGAVDNNWTNAANWDGAVQPGDDLVFPAGAAGQTPVNDFPIGTNFQSITIASSGYLLAGNPIDLTGGITATYTSGASQDDLDATFDTGSGSVSVAPGGALNIGGAIGGTQGLTLSGGGTLALTGATLDSYAGATTVNAGTLSLAKAGVVAVSGALVVNGGVVSEASPAQIADNADVTVNVGATLDLNGNDDTIGTLTLTGGTVQTGTGTLTLSGNSVTANDPGTDTPATITGNLALTAQTTFSVPRGIATTGADLDVGAQVSGAPGAGITKTGNGLLRLAGANTYDGVTDVNTGELIAGSATALGSPSSMTTVAPGASLALAAGITVANPLSVAGAGLSGLGALIANSNDVWSGPITLTGDTTLATGPGDSLILSGNIGDGGNGFGLTLNSDPTATVTLSGANTLTGTTAISAGELFVNGSVAGPVTLAAGATFAGDGTAGAVTSTGGTVTPGTSGPGVLGTGSLALDAASTFSAQLNGNTPGNYAGLNVMGTVNLGGAALSATVGGSYSPARGDSLVVINNDGSDPVVGMFAGLAEGSLVSFGAGKTFRITYVGGDGNDVALNFVQDTTTSVVSSVNPSDYRQAVTFTATVTAAGSGGGVPTGTVTFMDGAAALGTGTLDGSGVATFTTPALGVGSHSVTAVYGGDAGFITSTSPAVPQAVNRTSVSGAFLQLSINPAEYGQVLVFRVVLFPTRGGADPSGTVTFTEGATVLGTGTLDTSSPAGSQVYYFYQVPANPALSPGAHTITATYNGDANYQPATPPSQTQTVTQAGTTTFLSSSATPTVSGQSVTFTASVSPDFAGTPTGTVTFMDGAAALGTGTLDGTGTATLTTAALAVGSHSITAVYNGDDDFTSSTSSATTQDVNQDGVDASIASTANPSVFGQPVTLTVTVAAAAPGGGTPTGNVTFFDGATQVGVGTLDAGGQASVTLSSLAVADHPITVQYGGDGSFLPGTSPGLTQTVGKAPAAALITGSVNPAVFGQTVTFDAAVTSAAPGSGQPTGSVDFFDGASLLGTAPVDGTGHASFTTQALAVGGRTITAQYSGDGNFQAATSPFFLQGVNRDASDATIGSSVNPTVYGQPVSITTSVSAVAPGSGVPTGVVQLLDGGTVIATATLDPTGSATFSVSPLAVNSHTLSVSYAGDAAFTPVVSPTLVQLVNQAASAVTLATSVGSAVSGQPVTFTATIVAVAPGATAPTGTVLFFDGATQLTAVPQVNGSASYTTSLPVGGHSITALYLGSPNFLPGTSPAVSVPVSQASTAATVTGATNPSVYGQATAFDVTVDTLSPGGGVPSGTVTLMDGSTTLGLVQLVNGQGSFSTAGLAAGGHTITAVYNGDPDHLGSVSAAFVQSVSQASTSVALGSSVDPTVTGQSTTLTATVTAVAPGAGTADGTVIFFDGTTALGMSPLDGSGSATLAVADLAFGAHAITAVYAGAANFVGATSTPLTQTVNAANSSTTVLGSVNPSVYGQPVTLTALVTANAPGVGTPAGGITFFDGSIALGTAPLDAAGTATLSTSTLGVGVHSITAVYAGNQAFQGSTSPVSSQGVNKANTSGTLSPTVSAPVAGQSETFVVNVSPTSPGAGVPTGLVTFTDGALTLGTAALVGGVASFTSTGLSVGGHTIIASYAGDGNFNGVSPAGISLNVARASTTSALTAPLTATVFGQWLTFSVQVSADAPGIATPGGAVTFYDNGSVLGTANPIGGVAQLTAVALSPGGHSITAVYAGDGKTTGSTASAFAVNVAKDAVHVSLSIPAGTPVFGQPVPVTATLTAVAPGGGWPAGVVFFYDNGVKVGSSWVVAGKAQASLLLSPGGSTHTITATTTGDDHFNPGTPPPLVTSVVAANTRTTLVKVPVTGPTGSLKGVYLVAIVSPTTPAAGTATGTVTIFVTGGRKAGSLPGRTTVSTVNGSAFIFVGASGLNKTYTAWYNGNGNLNPSLSRGIFLGSSLKAMSRPMISLSARGKARTR